MNISNHAKQRMKERCGFNKKSQERMSEKALKCGITHAQTKGRLHDSVSFEILAAEFVGKKKPKKK